MNGDDTAFPGHDPGHQSPSTHERDDVLVPAPRRERRLVQPPAGAPADAKPRGAFFGKMRRARALAGATSDRDRGADHSDSGGADSPQPLDDVLTRTVRRWATPTSVDDLARRGVKTVRSVSMSKMASLLEKAVNRALIERTLESDTDEALSLSSTARDEFLRLTRNELDISAGPFAEEPLRTRATSTLDRLRRELDDRRRSLADHERKLSDGELDDTSDSKLANQIRELFATYAGTDQDRVLEQNVLGAVMGELRVSRRRARQARLEEHQREIGTLERRIEKLSVLLGETEDVLRRMRAGEQIDPGVSSIYDSVQGLSEKDESFEQKTVLMQSIFEANMALRA